MPKTLNPVNTFPTSIPNFPLAGNNEPVAIGPLEAAIQAVLNRTESLHQSRLTVEGAGVKRIQKVASLAALQNLAGMSDGDVVDVEGYGRYRLYNPSALVADGLWVLTAAGGGRWMHLLNLMRGGNSGLATLTSGGRLAQDVRDGSIATTHLADLSITNSKIANNTIAGNKLAPGAAVANIGYNPVNRAGDTMTGELITTGRIYAHRQHDSYSPTISIAIGDNDTGLHWGGDGYVQMYANNSAVGGWSWGGLDLNIPVRTNRGLATHWQLCRTDGIARWGWGLVDAETGSDTGSNLALYQLGDTGTNYMRAVVRRQAFEFAFYINANPGLDNTYNLGYSLARWSAVWAVSGIIQTSDAREKIDVQPSPLGLNFIERLRPVAYRWRTGGYVDEPIIEERQVQAAVDDKGNPIYEAERHARPNPVPRPGKRIHYGLIAQEVKAVLDELGVEDFGGWVLTDIADPDSQQALRYDQFIAPLIRAVQELSERLERLEQKTRNNRRNA